MQVLIDIPEEVYGRLCILTEHGAGSDAGNYILNGTILPEHGRLIDADRLALDKIRAEIEDKQSTKNKEDMDLYDLGLDDALKIIDKHIEGSKNERKDQ